MYDANPGLDLYNVYRFESLHNFYLGTFRTLLLALSSILKSDRMETAAFLDSRRRYRTPKSARTEILRRCNSALAAIDSDSPCVGLNFDFTKKGSTDTVSGLFTAKGIAPMLDARELAAVAQMIPFVFALVGPLCGAAGTAPCTGVAVLYKDTVALATSRFGEPGFTDTALMRLTDAIRDFKSAAIEVFGEHQASGMGTPKFHALDQLVSEIELCGSTGNYDAAFYESGHKIYKVAWGMTSQRSSTGQGEVVGIVERRQGQSDLAAAQMQISEFPLRESVVNKLIGKRNRVGAHFTAKKAEATRLDSVGLSTGGVKMPCAQILQHAANCNGTHAMRQPNSSADNTERNIVDLCEDVGGPGRLRWYVARTKDNINPRGNEAVSRPMSAVLAGLPCPTLHECESEGPGSDDLQIISVDNVGRESKRVVSAHRYYGSSRERHDNVMIEASSAGEAGGSNLLLNGSVVRRNVYIAKMLALLAIKAPGGIAAKYQNEEEVCLIRYYDRVESATLGLLTGR
jgi:hypothetical protein